MASHRAAYEKSEQGDLYHTRRHESGGTQSSAPADAPFELPDGWAWCKWGDISSSVQYGYNAPSMQTGRMRMVRITDIQDECIKWRNVPYCQIEEPKIPRYKLLKNDILFARTGGTVGKSHLITEMPFDAVYAGYLVRTRCAPGILPQYAKLFLESELYWSQLRTGMVATAQPNFNGGKLSTLVLPLPPLAEQKRIVARIEELFKIVDSLGRAADGLAEAVKRLDKKILDLAIRGKLVPQDPNEEPASELLKRIAATSHKSPCQNHGVPINPPFEIPKSWVWCRLGNVSDIIRGTGIKRNETTESGVQCVRYGEIYTGYGYSFSHSVSHVPKEVADNCHEATFGDVLCTLTGENEIEIAKATAYLGKERLVIGGDLAKITNHPYNPMLLVYFLFAPFMISQKAAVCTGGMIVHMGKSALGNLLIPLPPLAEQKRIVAKIEELRKATQILIV